MERPNCNEISDWLEANWDFMSVKCSVKIGMAEQTFELVGEAERGPQRREERRREEPQTATQKLLA